MDDVRGALSPERWMRGSSNTAVAGLKRYPADEFGTWIGAPPGSTRDRENGKRSKNETLGELVAPRQANNRGVKIQSLRRHAHGLQASRHNHQCRAREREPAEVVAGRPAAQDATRPDDSFAQNSLLSLKAEHKKERRKSTR